MFEDIFNPLLTTEWGRKLSIGILCCFVVLALVLAIKLPFNSYSDFLLAHPKNEQLPLITPETSHPKLIEEIAKKHLFGDTVALVQTIVPITSLQLKLIGIVYSTPNYLSRVIISEAAQPGKIYKINDHLPSGARISGITTDSVILENAGRIEKLPLQRTLISFQGRPKPLLAEE